MNSLIAVVGWTLIHFLWQGALVAAAAASLLRLAAGRSPSTRYLIACGALAAMLAMPVLTAAFIASAAEASSAEAAGHPTLFEQASLTSGAVTIDAGNASMPVRPSTPAFMFEPEQILRGVVLFWVAGVALLLTRIAGGYLRVRTLHRRALAVPSSRLQAACDRLASRLQLGRIARVVELSVVDVPTVVGWMRPVVILPVAAMSNLTAAQVDAILAHELAHVRRHDYLINIAQTLGETLLFYHPGVWWLSARIRAEREHCCDDIAVAVCGDRVGYAEALTELEAWRGRSPAMALAATDGSLIGRVRRILRVPAEPARATGWAPTLALTMLFIAGAGGAQRIPSFVSTADAHVALNLGRGWIEITAQHAATPVLPAPEPPALTPAVPLPPVPPAQPAPVTEPVPPVDPLPTPGPASHSDAIEQGVPPVGSLQDREQKVGWSENGERMEIRLLGAVTFNDALTDVATLSDGGYLTIREWSGVVPHTIEITTSGGQIAHTYYVAGVRRPWDADAQRILARLVERAVRRAGLASESRTRSILARGGVAGVLAEITLLETNRVRRLYVEALAQFGNLDASTVIPVLNSVRERIARSDHERGLALRAIAEHVKLDEASGYAFITAIGGMQSDHEKGQVLIRALRTGKLSLQARNGVLEAAIDMNSDNERRQVLTVFVEAYDVDGGSTVSFFRAVSAMHSDHERAETLLALAGSQTIDAGIREAMLDAADGISSDREQNRVLRRLQ